MARDDVIYSLQGLQTVDRDTEELRKSGGIDTTERPDVSAAIPLPYVPLRADREVCKLCTYHSHDIAMS